MFKSKVVWHLLNEVNQIERDTFLTKKKIFFKQLANKNIQFVSKFLTYNHLNQMNAKR